jgi:hypothetical protein
MKRFAQLSILVTLLAAQTFAAEPEAPAMPEMPKPTKENEWLEQFAGEWTTESEMYMVPEQPPIKATGEETARMIGGFWLMAENKGKVFEMPMTGILTVGYDAEKKSYVGTWIDSMTGYMWKYAGTVDDQGKALTLETRGPCPKRPGELSNFKEVLELKDKDHKVFTSSMQEEDGSWTKMVTMNYRRKK